MTKIKHRAIFSNGLSMKSPFIQNLLKGNAPDLLTDLKNKKGVLYSGLTLEQFIKEEAIHDNFTLSQNQKRSIRTYSSGEQRTALLNYLISTSPDFLILDNVSDMLDQNARTDLIKRLSELSTNISILQIVRRNDNLLPFINNVIHVKNEEIDFSGTVDEYRTQFNVNQTFKLAKSLPPPMERLPVLENPLVEFKNISVKYGEQKILDNINWTINNGDFWQLTGPNGSGKTTLLTMVTGDNPKAYGQDLVLFGKKRGSGESIWDIKKKIGYVTPSMTTLFRGWNTVEKMIISGLVDSIGLYQKATELQRRLADEWIDLIGLSDLKHTRFANLNEGRQCMVLIARAMIKHPPLLILDEPSHGLNDYSAMQLTALTNKIAEEGRTTIIYVSHRKESGLNPRSIFELTPSETGSIGMIT